MRKPLIILATLALALSGTTSADAATKKFTVKVTTSLKSMQLGQSNTIKGTVWPRSTGATVKLYVHYASDPGSKYRYVGKDKLDSKGRFSKKFVPKISGDTRVKVVKAKTSTRPSASARATFENWGWLKLNKLARTVENGTVSYVRPRDPDGYADFGVSLGNGGRAHFDLRSKCSEFSARTGMDSGSPQDSFGQAKFLAQRSNGTTLVESPTYSSTDGDDRQDAYVETYVLSGTTETPARYLEITTQVTDPDAIWGVFDPVVYCNLPGAKLEDAH